MPAPATGGSQAVTLPPPPPRPTGRRHEWTLRAAARPARLLGPDGPESQLWTYAEAPLPVLRASRGDSILARLDNALPEHTAIHWHGVRVPNAMDGVPWVTQPPVLPGESFTYAFTPPDPGTFFLHPHCNETGQVGRGMAAVLVVEGDEPEPSHADLVLACKDWRLDAAGQWLPFLTPQGAGRAGTFGTLRTVNAQRAYAATIPAHGDIRLRLLNLDSTRLIMPLVRGAEAVVLAVDGVAVPPFPLGAWRLGPAMRLDLLLRAPAAGAVVEVLDQFPREPFPLARLEAVASPLASPLAPRPFAPRGLYAPEIPRPDLHRAERLSFRFTAALGGGSMGAGLPPGDPFAALLLDALCAAGGSLWAINASVWPAGEHARLPPPLAELVAGRSYVFQLENLTPHPHPIHLHGHSVRVLSQSRQENPPHWADTVLLLPREKAEIAFVAAPGNWMFHCHVLEHLETGMMGWFRVRPR
ncbi:multicopper oxidase family protein [Roseomonas sp. GC11]|uniref:multicopper oxidase family protein n=1 Tax=Roseomonas sp. GC11 TaxID=2950546 RepID=UPI00210EBBBC|nr:multicopper oxidase family protein [Roseomonas sp. GC11]MCQ4161035.1 multicopper oxidase family protein [Roseomonas sp. GC11]